MRVKKILVSCLASTIFACSMISALNVSAISDPNGDGNINLYDAIFISEYLEGKICPTHLERLDFNGNGIVSIADAQELSNYIMSH